MTNQRTSTTDTVHVEILVEPDRIGDAAHIRAQALAKAGRPDSDPAPVRVVRRSIDARARMPRFQLRVAVGGEERGASIFRPAPLGGKRAVVVGAGPGGYFAALTLLEAGIRPVLLERGRDVRSRLKDVKRIYSEGLIDPHSNYCFGEGGAGTYSDGKLYTRATKRGDVDRILDLFVSFGASEDIRVDAHPHLGSNVLPRLVRGMREAIVAAGGEIHFGAHVSDLLLDGGRVRGVRLAGGESVEGDAVILATGHSARDVYHLLQRQGVRIEAKPFALGVRIEHPQALVDRMFYHQSPRHPALPAASYRLACQTAERGVFSFCMCPGGFVVPASTAPGELVLNGMSLASRSAPFANAGLVAEVRPDDVAERDPLALLHFQASVEQDMFRAGDGTTQRAPAQRVPDFLAGRLSGVLGKTSYIPGVYVAPLHELLPGFVARALREGLSILGAKHKGFDSAEATLLAVESRTSSPVRIPRDRETLMHPEVSGLFPCGEGAGYAGGIVSAAMDGVAVAQAVLREMKK
ncbi:NAD(P)/FAD-dependent oxidoreductase [Desulfomicrobium salsuginis]